MTEPEEDELSTSSGISSRRTSRSSSADSDSSASTSSSTSSSGSRIVLRPCTSPSDEPFPYCILNAIPEHTEVEHALYDLLEAMTDDVDFVLDQAQFGFLLGYTTYCLVLGNGSKQNVISKMTLGDFRNSKKDERSGLYYFSFFSKSSCSQKDTVEYLCADERIWRAMEIFEVARERRAREAQWKEMDIDSSPFFCSFVSPNFITKDTNYPMSQFLRMCGITDFPCRSSAICSAAWSLVPKDKAKGAHVQYAITYFKMLREKEKGQLELLRDLNSHPTYSKILNVRIEKAKRPQKEKVRKKQKRYTTPERRGLPNRPRGGDHKSEEFKRRTGREVVEKKSKRVKKEAPDQNNYSMPEMEVEEEELISSLQIETAQIVEADYSSSSSSLPTGEYRVEKIEGDRTMTCL